MVTSQRSLGPINRAIPRNLGILRELLLNGYFLSIPTVAAWTEVVAGSGVSSLTVAYLECGTGTTTSSTSRRYTALLNSTTVDLNKRVLWGFSIRRFTSDAAIIARVQLKAATTEGALGARGLGVRAADLTLTGESYETADAFTATIQAMVSGTTYHILVDHEPAIPRTRFYVGGVLQATVTAAANVPVGTVDAGMIVSILNGAGTANGLIEVGYCWLYQAL